MDTNLITTYKAESVGKEGQAARYEEKKADRPAERFSLNLLWKTDAEGQSFLLIHAQSKLDHFTVTAYDIWGRKKEIIYEARLEDGFYEFILPSDINRQLFYWHVTVDGEHVSRFIK